MVDVTQEYVEAAMAQATFEVIEVSDEIYGRIPACPGVWATGATREECSSTLATVLQGWILLGPRFGDKLPDLRNPTETS
jgi:predicted RNase H-like HicB family nuclease